MRSERKQEIAKAKLKKARQQLNVQASPQQTQAGGSAPVTATTQATAIPAGSPAITPPQANVPRKVQVGRPARVAQAQAHATSCSCSYSTKENYPTKAPCDKE